VVCAFLATLLRMGCSCAALPCGVRLQECPLTPALARARAGIGKSLAERLASQGINVVLVALQVLEPRFPPQLDLTPNRRAVRCSSATKPKTTLGEGGAHAHAFNWLQA
jgi:hypothetical protein